jgi:hypothetical protein
LATADTVTLSRADFEELVEAIQDTEDRLSVLEDCLLDQKPELGNYNLALAETIRTIEGKSPSRSGARNAAYLSPSWLMPWAA